MEKLTQIYNNKVTKQLECMKEDILKYNDALIDILGDYSVYKSHFGNIYLSSELGTDYLLTIKDNNLCLSYQDKCKCNRLNFCPIENGIVVNEIIIDFHNNGTNVEIVERLYGKSKYDENKNVLLDLKSTNYVIKNCSSIIELMATDIEKESILTTTFSSHMKSFYQTEGETRENVSTIYPSNVYFNGEDISNLYEFVDDIDKISRIYNLYSGSFRMKSEDFYAINTGLADECSFNYKNRKIGNQVEELIGEPKDINERKVLLTKLPKTKIRYY